MQNNNQFANVIRWAARITGTAIVVITMVFAIGNFLEGQGKPVPEPFSISLIITFVFWGIGLAGLVLALWKEALGGIISLMSFIIFITLVAIKINPESRFSYVLFIFLLPSVLYLYYWWLAKKSSNNI